MYKLLLVDDEQDIRHGMAKGIPWAEWGFEIIGEAQNGCEAIEFIEKLRPEVVLSDIRMPKMDGMGLMRYLNEHYPEIKIIILSGYNDVEYLNASIKNGVMEYLLKPTDLDEFEQLFQRLRKKLDEENKREEEYKQLVQNVAENLEFETKRILLRLIKGYYATARSEELQRTGLDFGHCIVVAIDMQQDELGENKEVRAQFYILKNQIVEFCNQREEGWRVQFFLDGEEKVIGILTVQIGEESDWKSYVVAYMQELQMELSDIYGLELSIGISNYCSNPGMVSDCYEQAVISVNQRIFLGGYSIVFFDEFKKYGQEEYYINTFDMEKVKKYISSGEEPLLQELLGEIEKRFSKKMLKDYRYIDRMCMECLYNISRWTLAHYNIRLDVLPEEYRIYGADFSKYKMLRTKMNHMAEYLHLLNKAVVNREGSAKRTKGLVQIIKDYIEKEYCNNLISLEYVADKVQKNSAYISKVFKKETSYNFSDYVAMRRIEKSKELLQDYSVKIYEIAEQVGYADGSNFIKVFKKYCGISPNEYRNLFGGKV